MDADHVYERILVDVVVEPGPEVTWPNPAAVGEARKVLWTAGS
jgi:hypothetical protein